jgi:hypothetical protein
VVAYAVLLLAFGLMKSWSAPACNNPIFSMLVPAHCRNLIYAFDRWVLSKKSGLNLLACNHGENLHMHDAARQRVCNVCAGALKVRWQWIMTYDTISCDCLATCAKDRGNVAGSHAWLHFQRAGALASCAAPLVGLLAERYFGFDGTAARSADGEPYHIPVCS